MDVLKAEIAKKRKLLEERMGQNTEKKYFKRSELLAKQEVQKESDPTKENEHSPEKSCNNSRSGNTNSTKEVKTLPRAEVIRRLRDRNEAILLFGETELEAFQRLRQCEILQPEIIHGFRNDFHEAMEEVDQAYLNEIVGEQSSSKAQKKEEEYHIREDITIEDIQEMAKHIGRGNKDQDHTVIATLLQFILNLWNAQLNILSQSDRMSTKIKIARATFTQTKLYMKPLFRKLKTKTLPEDILDSLTDITKLVLNRNYIKASDAYLQMAIGNAPWPIGVTMVGIHARTGREKIFSKNVAHVMNDETQRKYIQGLKRLMTKCQEYFPTDPSRCVEYVSKKDQTTD